MQYIMFDGYMAIAVSVLYTLVAAALVVAILKAERIRRNVSGDKSTNTYKLVIVMAVSVFIAEATYGGLYYFNYHIFQGFDEQSFFKDLDAIVLIILCINSVTHCLMCFCMSAQYRSVVKRLVWKGKKDTDIVSIVRSSAQENTSKTSN